MDEFFNKHHRMIRYVLYSVAFLVSLVILFLFIQTSAVWKKIGGEVFSSLFPFFVAFLLAYLIHPLILWGSFWGIIWRYFLVFANIDT